MFKKLLVVIFILVDVVLALFLLLHNHNIDVLNPAGIVAIKERDVMFFAAGLGLIVIIPTVLATFYIAYKYRADNKKANYRPEWDKNLKLDIFRWVLMCSVIGILGIVTIYVAYTQNPYTPIKSNVKPLTIQVVALQWRWLFIYPEQNIATINYIEIPEKTPVNFHLTADAPMNSFWIPSLAGQIYAMTGMSTTTHVMVDRTGKFQGLDAEISGKDFAKMRFTVKSVTNKDFNSWVENAKNSSQTLDFEGFKQLAKPSSDSKIQYFTLLDKNLYNEVMAQYMAPMTGTPGMQMTNGNMNGMNMK